MSDPKDINPFPETDPEAPKDIPPLTVMSLSVRTVVNHKENKRELICATARIWSNSKHVSLPHHSTTLSFDLLCYSRYLHPNHCTSPLCLRSYRVVPRGTQSVSMILLPRNRFHVPSTHSCGHLIGSLQTLNLGPRQAQKASSHQ